MSDFDPYLKWLGIRDSQRPPNHYRLLGIEIFEEDIEVIAAAADRQSTYVASFLNSEHREHSTRLLNELTIASRCLLSRPTKLAYDELLHSAAQPRPATTTVVERTETPVVAIESHSRSSRDDRWRSDNAEIETSAPQIRERPKRNDRYKVWVMLFSWVSGGVAAVLVAGWIINSGFLDRLRGDQVAVQPEAEPVKEHPKIIRAKPKDPPREAVVPPAVIPEEVPVDEFIPVEPEPKRVNLGDPLLEARNNAPGPWDGNRFPPVPHLLLNPDREIDLLLQETRAAIAIRDFDQAEKKWKRISANARQLDRTIDLGQEIDELKKFWKVVMNKIQRLGPGDTLAFQGTTLQVFRAADKGVWLRTLGDNNATKYFPIDKENVDRDLVAAAAAIDNVYLPDQIDRFLQMDFAHERNRLERILRNNGLPKANPGNEGNDRIALAINDPAKANRPAANNGLRKPIPDKATIVDSRRIIKKTFSTGYLKTSAPATRQRVARLMFSRTADFEARPEQLFALLTEVASISRAIGDGRTGIKALDKLREEFQIDYWDLVRSFMIDTTKNAKGFHLKNELATVYRTLVIRALQDKEYDAARFLANKATFVTNEVGSQKVRNKALLLKNETKELARHAGKAEKASEALKTDPDNAQANSELGNFLCLVEDDFDSGLKHWAKSDEPEERLVSSLEQKFKDKPSENLKAQLGDAWFALGENKRTFQDARCLERAKFWKKRALGKTAGLYRKKLESEISAIEALLDRLPSIVTARELGW